RTVFGMESDLVSDERPLKKCLDDVAACDVYVGIIAWRYGFIPKLEENPDQRSITELEYRKALELGKPCLLFLTDPGSSWPPNKMDSHGDPKDRGARIE